MRNSPLKEQTLSYVIRVLHAYPDGARGSGAHEKCVGLDEEQTLARRTTQYNFALQNATLYC